VRGLAVPKIGTALLMREVVFVHDAGKSASGQR